MASPSSDSSRPESAVAIRIKEEFIPMVREEFDNYWPTESYLYENPLQQISIARPLCTPRHPTFVVGIGDPVDYALDLAAWESETTNRKVYIPFICAANSEQPGGEWETDNATYEERLCRRSNLSATLSTPG